MEEPIMIAKLGRLATGKAKAVPTPCGTTSLKQRDMPSAQDFVKVESQTVLALLNANHDGMYYGRLEARRGLWEKEWLGQVTFDAPPRGPHNAHMLRLSRSVLS
jgi:hypothetical protein